MSWKVCQDLNRLEWGEEQSKQRKDICTCSDGEIIIANSVSVRIFMVLEPKEIVGESQEMS